ncbi:ABC transporter permease subunit [uncultured Actinomyces sp.]|uniref:ABC transporter permease subunit n=1 Tax=uncultured Actinomyces sp. TaxID=249061 RepID=UPI0028D33990|nr:ABC transporter permease subunit [uncultured Actinomyces sp.]
MLTRLAGSLRRYDVVAGTSRLVALVCLIGLVGMLPWLSGKDPALTILRATSSDREPTPEVLESIRKSIGIDGGPLHTMGRWLAGLVHGDLGRSWVSGAPVGPDAVDAFGVSLSLMAAALGVGLVIVAALVLPALRDGLRGQPRPRGGAVSAVLISLPEYLLAPILMLVLAVYLRILPPFGWGSPEKVIMPALSLGLPTGGYLGGLISDAVTATFSERWVATWSTAGIRGGALAGAVLRRALTPLAGQVALVVVALTGGAVAVEKIFAIPGIGRELIEAASAQDVPALQAQILLLLALALTTGIIAGIVHRLLMGRAAGAGGLTAPPPVEQSGRAARVIAVIGAVLLVLMVAVGIRRDPYAIVADKLAEPSTSLPLGADSLGRDVLARVAHGALSTVTGAVAVTVVCFVIALLVGLVPRASAGFIEVANAAPPVLAGLIVAGVSGPSATGAAIAVASVGWAPLASHAAGLVAEARRRPDILLAPVLGEGRVRITVTRVVPAVVGPLARHAALRLPGKALALAALGFLGLGAQSPAPDWGLVLSDALPYIERAPWAVATPAAALVILSITSVAASRSMRR